MTEQYNIRTVEAEKLLVGSILTNPDLLGACHCIDPRHFSDPHCRVIYQAELETKADGGNVGLVEIYQRLKAEGKDETCRLLSGLSSEAAEINLDGMLYAVLEDSGGLEEIAAAMIPPEEREAEFFADIHDELLNPIEPIFLVDDIVEDKTTGATYGESTSGKSFIQVDMSCCIATKTPWIGHEIKRPGPVIYFAGEGRQGIPRRVQAWQDHHGVTIPRGRFYLPRTRIEFNQAGARLVACEIEKLPETPVLIVIDTVARSLPAGSDENSSKDMMEFINAVDGLRDRFGCTVCLVHHTGHSAESQGRARGSSAFRAAMDWELLVDKKGSQLRWTKMKDAETPDPVGFELVQVGESAVVTYNDQVAQPTGPTLTKGEELGLKTLATACENEGRAWVTLEEWRQEFYRRHTGDNPDSKRQAFHRVRGRLTDLQRVIVDNDIYRPTTVTSVTRRDNSPNVTGDCRDKRDTTLKGVTTVTHRPQPEVNAAFEVIK